MSAGRLLRTLPVLLSTAVSGAPSRASAQAVQVINMIPNLMSDEANRDNEPFLAINPLDPRIITATAFMPTPAMVSNGPLLVSFDGGTTWVARGIIPSAAGGLNTFDVTIRFNTGGSTLYAGMLRDPTVNLEIVRTTDMTFSTPMTLLNTPRATDQPYIFARTVTGWFDPGKDRLWVGNNEGAVNPNSATVDQTLDAAAAMPVFTQVRLDAGAPVGRDNYQVRTVAHADGHVYAAFYRRRGAIAGGYNADVVVVRDDNWGKGAPAFQALVDGVTMISGQNVEALDPISDSFGGSDPLLGFEWWGGDLYLMVDPNDASRLYISYSDSRAGAARTLHLRRSTDHGQTWGADLLTTSGAKNAAIAINSHGRIAYLYQSLVGASPNLHWQTHLRRSSDGVTWDDLTLSDFPAQGATAPACCRIIGDYLNMVAVGQNFYGVFSAYNSLAVATFPAGVTWQRNRTPMGDPMPRLLGNDGITTVAPSIDPFFFRTTEVDPATDFYVRDWTDDATTHDRGQEPSVRNVFYHTSDVWNVRTNDPLAFDANDRPQVQDPQPVAAGHNFAFARVSRETSGSVADVSLHYLVSDGGVGVNFVDAGSPPPLHFDVGDLSRFPAAGAGHQWDLPSGASNHVCLAVEIAAPGDPLLAPSLLGHAPGWPTTDLMVVNDNNKAQRNLQVFGYGGMSSNGQRMSMFALVHNAATFVRDMIIGIAADRASIAGLREATVRIIGGPRPAAAQVRTRGALTVPGMQPGENRWIELSFAPAATRRPSSVDVVELVNGVPLNGYAFVAAPMPLADAIRATLLQHATVFRRLGDAFTVDGAAEQGARARREAERASPSAYLEFHRAESKSMAGMTRALVKRAGGRDPFDATRAADALVNASGDPGAVQMLHLALLNRLDATQTMLQKEAGDPADIPQDVRWQRELFARMKDLRGASEVARRSSAFLAAFEQRKIGVDGVRPLLASLQGPFGEAAALDRSGRLTRLLAVVGRAESLAALQKAHRSFLLALEPYARR